MSKPPKDYDEKIKIDLDPVDALKGLLAVDPDDDPVTEDQPIYNTAEDQR